MVPYIQPIFSPNSKYFEINKKSIISMSKYVKKYPYDVKFVFGGWTATDDIWNDMEKIIRDNFDEKNLYLKRFDRNYGKAYIVNDLFKFVKDLEFNFFLTADSDIQFVEDTPYLFERLLEMTAHSKKARNKTVGLIALNQLGHNCHLKHIYKNEYKYVNTFGLDEKYVHGNRPGGLGGGCLFINKKGWIEVNGYRVMGVYAGDDAYILLDLNSKGYSIQMSDSIGVFHPRDHDSDYAKWKGKVCQRDSGKEKSPERYREILEETEEYWKNKDEK